MRIISAGVKGFPNDRTGIFSWTQEILLEHDPMYPDLTPAQIEEIRRSLDQQREIIMANAVAWAAEETARQDAARAPKQQPPAPAAGPKPTEEELRVMRETAEATKPSRKAGEETAAPEQRGTDGYNKDNRTWVRCPTCGSTDVCHHSGAGKYYQACKMCRIWLEPDGTTAKMGAAK